MKKGGLKFVLKTFTCFDCSHTFEELQGIGDVIDCPECNSVRLYTHKGVESNWSQGRHSSVKLYDTEPIGGDDGY